MADTENSIAVFVDFENLALGFEGRRGPRFEIQKVLERLVEKGKIIVKRAYADWGRFREYRAGLHEAAIELIEIPRRSMTGKNSADIRLVVDAMDLSYSKAHVDTFVIISGDSDFSPLVSKLKENGKRVIGLGMKSSTSDLLVDNCDEFIFYEDLDRPALSAQTYEMKEVPVEKRKLFGLVMDAIVALRRENKEVIWSSMVKDTIKRKRPQFNETYYGYRSFSNVLEDGQKYGLLSLTTDPRSGTYVVSEAGAPRQAVPSGGAGNGGPGPRPEPRRDENGGREDRWSRRRGRRGRYEDRQGDDRRERPWANGEAAGAEAAEGAAPVTVPAPTGEYPDQEPAAVYEPRVEAVPVEEAVPAYAADERDEYGFPRYESGREDDELPEARDERVAEPEAPVARAATDDAEPAAPESDDDRTPEERELDARAARLAHSRETTDSPLKTPRGAGARGGRTRTGGTGGTGPARGRGRAAAGDGAAAPAARRGRSTASRPAASSDSGTGKPASGGSTGRGGRRTSGGAARPRAPRKPR